MAKLVLLHRDDTTYDDEPDRVYDFPARYLSAMRQGVGDWVVYYEPVKAGARGYFAVARIEAIDPHPRVTGRWLARIAPGTYLDFDRDVPRLFEGKPLEAALAAADGGPRAGGLQQAAVRPLPETDFARIVRLGLPADLDRIESQSWDPMAGNAMDQPAAPFDRPVVERLTSRAYRDIAFRRRVRAAYGYRCAVSGLRLRNGGGRPEVQAAHIRPIASAGSDSVRNGLALSGTLHWMFDRGLLSVAEDFTILVSHNKVPREVTDRLIVPGGRLVLPADRRDWPHPENLRWHRQNVFGTSMPEGPAPWD